MPCLILVKHSLPEVVPGLPPNQWRLSNDGRLHCAPLAEKLRAYQPEIIISSLEPKAQETAHLVAEQLGMRCVTMEGLHEHDRGGTPFLDAARFEATVEMFFAEPAKLVIGRETADAAHARFSGAVARVMEKHPGRNVVIVAHGTVITLLVSRANGLAPFPLWKRLGMPSFIVLALPDLRLSEVVE